MNQSTSSSCRPRLASPFSKSSTSSIDRRRCSLWVSCLQSKHWVYFQCCTSNTYISRFRFLILLDVLVCDSLFAFEARLSIAKMSTNVPAGQLPDVAIKGMISKKSSSAFVGWRDRYTVVSGQSLVLYKTEAVGSFRMFCELCFYWRASGLRAGYLRRGNPSTRYVFAISRTGSLPQQHLRLHVAVYTC